MTTSTASETSRSTTANAHVLDHLAPHISREIRRVQRFTVLLNQDGHWITAMRFQSLAQARGMAESMSQQSGLDVEVRDQNGTVHCSIRH